MVTDLSLADELKPANAVDMHIRRMKYSSAGHLYLTMIDWFSATMTLFFLRQPPFIGGDFVILVFL